MRTVPGRHGATETAKKIILVWELIGIGIISAVGSFLHFAFEMSGQLKVVAVIAAVNESVWEHLKIAFWPAMFFAAVEYPFLRKLTPNLLFAKFVGIYAMPISIVALFYSYTAVLGHHVLVLDILIFVASVAIGQIASYSLLIAHPLRPSANRAALVLLTVIGLTFGVMTFYTPHLAIFRDGVTGTYGLGR